MSQSEKLFANGKLLLTGEYLVMEGATALALPLNKRQVLISEPSHTDFISWTAYDTEGIWFEGIFKLTDFSIIESSDAGMAAYLINIFQQAAIINPNHLIREGRNIITQLNFHHKSGFGSSSTLIALIAKLFEIDKFKLHSRVSKGSGYDIACTDTSSPILYKREKDQITIEPVVFKPSFSQDIYFVYLGKKQNTDEEIVKFYQLTQNKNADNIKLITNISLQLLQVEELSIFIALMEQHEKIMSKVLNLSGLKQRLFNDFQGAVKSLGAWGGDYILAATNQGYDYVVDYFKKKNMVVVYKFDEIVLNENSNGSSKLQVRL